ncbi:MAG: alpha-L-fucosidase [Deinococcota bacterium]
MPARHETTLDHSQALANIATVIDTGPFDATWESLQNFEIPEWYLNDKFGIFIHWGVYSVPAFGNEWYARNMYLKGSQVYEHHLNTYGKHTEFGYKDFIPKLTAANYDPAAWAKLFKDAGAKFVMPVAEHHDGFPMYDSDVTPWCASKMGPKRDVVGKLADAVRAEGMVFSASSHRAENWWFFDGGLDYESDVTDPANAELYGPPQPSPKAAHGTAEWKSRNWDPAPNEEFLNDWLVRTCEIIDKYRPQVLWFDWWIEQHVFEPYLQKLAAYYYNRAAEWGIGVAINHKFESFPVGTTVFDIERGQLNHIRDEFWQNDTSVSKNSWGYISHHDYKPVSWLIQDLVDIVSKNGALLLNIGPKPDGSIPQHEQDMLLEIGKWLSLNGEAIYNTRPWDVYGEGPTEVPEGHFTDTKRTAFQPEDIRFTQNGNTLYATLLAWPKGSVTLTSLKQGSSLAANNISKISLLGDGSALAFSQDSGGLNVTLPESPPCEHANVLKLELG